MEAPSDMTNASTIRPPATRPMYAFDVAPDGSAAPTPPDAIDLPPPPDVVYRWIHLDLNDGDVHGWLRRTFDETVADALTPKDTRPRAVRHGRGVLLNMRGVNTNPDAEPEDMVSIRMWVGERRIVSVRLRRLAAVVAIRERMEAGNAPRTRGWFVLALIEGLLERAEPVIRTMSERVDALEAAGLKSPKEIRDALAELRNDAIVYRRFFFPQRDALTALAAIDVAMEPPLFDAEGRNEMTQLIDRQVRMIEEIDAIRERGLVLNDQLTNEIAERMNRNMMVLSIVAAIFLPLGFLTGLLGINVAGIPGANYPYAFAIVVATTFAIAAALFWWFRSHDWL
ncbi:MAG: zinc transporter ZntB [Alphaproteobacteria bacterium]|nr:zinc transporter ZntB [Alphaproteobacteria bacterium]